MHPMKAEGSLESNFLIHSTGSPQFGTRYSDKIKYSVLAFQSCKIKMETTLGSRKANKYLLVARHLSNRKIS